MSVTTTRLADTRAYWEAKRDAGEWTPNDVWWLLEQVERLREAFVSWAIVDRGITEFDLHNDAVMRFRAAVDALEDLHREALKEAERLYPSKIAPEYGTTGRP